MKTTAVLLLCAAFTVLCGCKTRIADLTFVSTKNIDASRNLCPDMDERVSGSVKCTRLLFIPFGDVMELKEGLKESVDRAIEKKSGAVALSDVVIEHSWRTILVISYSDLTVKGNPVYYEEDFKKKNR